MVSIETARARVAAARTVWQQLASHHERERDPALIARRQSFADAAKGEFDLAEQSLADAIIVGNEPPDPD